jgi:uncharacterized protein (TIGR00661 family)
MNKVKILFIVQGEGRGHMTQAIALKQLMNNSSLELVAVLIGKSPMRVIPDFFTREINCDIIEFESPNFLQDKNAKAIRVWRSIFYNLWHWTKFLKSIRKINSSIKKYTPDVIINFYEPLAGLHNFFYRPNAKVICIAHQYLYLHPDFIFPSGVKRRDVNTVKRLTKITAIGADKKLALSFYKVKRENYGSIKVIAPLLRTAVKEQVLVNGNYILVYLLNSGLMQDIINWHQQYPETTLHCFTDHKQNAEEWQYDDKLIFHRLDDKKFIKLMAGAAGVVTTAGFETVCEAMYMGKPTLMVPVKKHFEQYCNARDAFKAGAGIFDDSFKIERLLDYLRSYSNDHSFADWVSKSDQTILNELLINRLEVIK